MGRGSIMEIRKIKSCSTEVVLQSGRSYPSGLNGHKQTQEVELYSTQQGL